MFQSSVLMILKESCLNGKKQIMTFLINIYYTSLERETKNCIQI